MRTLLFTLLLSTLAWCATIAQPVVTPQNMALGGGGVTYITDYNANFINPANLLIKDRKRSIDIGLFSTTTSFNAVRNHENLFNQLDNYRLYFENYDEGSYDVSMTEKRDIIEDHYKRERLLSVHQANMQSTLFGLSWKRSDKAYSIAMRSRVGSTIGTGRNWYTSQPVVRDNVSMWNQSLNHDYQILHEISFGYAETLPLFNGLSSRLDRFMIGIAPKFIIAGAYQNAEWKNTYNKAATSDDVNRSQTFSCRAVGSISDVTKAYLEGEPADNATTNLLPSLKNEIQNVYGYGVGLDVGFTYLLTFGSDFSTLNDRVEQTRKSLRVSFSITDIGFVKYNKQGIVYDEQSQNTTITTSPSSGSSSSHYATDEATEMFVGAPGQYLNYLVNQSNTNPFNTFDYSEEYFSTMLPTAVNTGIMLELNRIKMMGDFSVGLSNNAFNTTKLVTSVGMELRPIKFLPLRGGIQIIPGLPGSFNVGTAIETKKWDLSLSAGVSARAFTNGTYTSGIGVAALQFHL